MGFDEAGKTVKPEEEALLDVEDIT